MDGPLRHFSASGPQVSGGQMSVGNMNFEYNFNAQSTETKSSASALPRVRCCFVVSLLSAHDTLSYMSRALAAQRKEGGRNSVSTRKMELFERSEQVTVLRDAQTNDKRLPEVWVYKPDLSSTPENDFAVVWTPKTVDDQDHIERVARRVATVLKKFFGDETAVLVLDRRPKLSTHLEPNWIIPQRVRREISNDEKPLTLWELFKGLREKVAVEECISNALVYNILTEVGSKHAVLIEQKEGGDFEFPRKCMSQLLRCSREFELVPCFFRIYQARSSEASIRATAENVLSWISSALFDVTEARLCGDILCAVYGGSTTVLVGSNSICRLLLEMCIATGDLPEELEPREDIKVESIDEAVFRQKVQETGIFQLRGFEKHESTVILPRQDSEWTVFNLVAVNGMEEILLGPVPLSTTGARIRHMIAEKVATESSALRLYFEGGPFQDNESLEDVGFNLDGTDRVTFTRIRAGGAGSIVSNLVAVSGMEEISLGPVPLFTTGAEIKCMIAEKVATKSSALCLYFEGGPFQDNESLEDVGFNLDGTDRVTFTVAVAGGGGPIVSNLVATDGQREISLGLVALYATGAEIRRMIAEKIARKDVEVAVYFGGRLIGDDESLNDLDFNPDESDKISFDVRKDEGCVSQ